MKQYPFHNFHSRIVVAVVVTVGVESFATSYDVGGVITWWCGRRQTSDARDELYEMEGVSFIE
jgi:hypothetical protein